jgi:hypothetical protein
LVEYSDSDKKGFSREFVLELHINQPIEKYQPHMLSDILLLRKVVTKREWAMFGKTHEMQ